LTHVFSEPDEDCVAYIDNGAAQTRRVVGQIIDHLRLGHLVNLGTPGWRNQIKGTAGTHGKLFYFGLGQPLFEEVSLFELLARRSEKLPRILATGSSGSEINLHRFHTLGYITGRTPWPESATPLTGTTIGE